MKIKSKYLEKIIILLLISLLGLTLVGCSSGSSGGTEAEDLVIESFSVDNESPLYIALGTVGQEVIDYYLDSQVEVKLSNGDTVNADIVWEVPDDYDSQIEGSYIFKGIYDIKDVGNGELEVEVILSDEVTSISGYVSIDYDFSDLSTSVSSVEVYEAESASTSSIADSEENKLIIGFSPHSKKVERMNLVEKHGAQLRKNLSSLNAAAVTVSTDVDSFIKNINKSKIVEYVEKDQKAYAVGEVVPDDNYYSEQWNLKMTALNYSWYNEKGNSDIKIAVIDTGINVNHPDLTDKIDIENSYNFVDDSSNIADKEGHGTHVAGTAAASTNNTEGIAGVGWNSKILALKALENGSGYHSDIAEAIMYAAGLSDDPKRIEAVDVINMSLGSSSENETLKNAVSKAAEAGVILVAAAGNNGSGLNYPAAYEEVISVAAVDSTGNIADFSNAGSGMDLAAPGQSILSTVPNKDYDYFSGTSMAAPHVSGVISLMLAEGISPYDIRESLHQASVHPGEESYSTDYGYGIINSSLALSGIDKIKIIIGQRQGSSFEKEAETSISIKGGRYSFPNLESGIYSIYTWIDTNQDNIINTGDYLNEHSNKGYSPGKSYIEDLTTHIDYDKSIK